MENGTKKSLNRHVSLRSQLAATLKLSNPTISKESIKIQIQNYEIIEILQLDFDQNQIHY